MKKSKVKIEHNLMVNVHPGSELDVIVDGSTMYVPVMTLPDITGGSTKTEKTPTPEQSVPEKESATDKSKADVATNKGSEEQSNEIPSISDIDSLDSKELLAIIEKQFPDVDVDEALGGKRKTRKQLSILLKDLLSEEPEEPEDSSPKEKEDTSEADSKEEAPEEEEAEAEAEEAPEEEEEVLNKLTEKLLGTLNSLDADEITTNTAEKEFIAFPKEVFEFEKEEEKELKILAKEAMETFTEDADKPLEDIAKEFVAKLVGEEDDYDSMETVDKSDLKVGDQIAAFWSNEEDAWFQGEVISKKRGAVNVKWEDDETTVIDTEIHTKIVLLNS